MSKSCFSISPSSAAGMFGRYCQGVLSAEEAFERPRRKPKADLGEQKAEEHYSTKKTKRPFLLQNLGPSHQIWGIFRHKRLKCFKQQLIIWSTSHLGSHYQENRHTVRHDAHLNTVKAH